MTDHAIRVISEPVRSAETLVDTLTPILAENGLLDNQTSNLRQSQQPQYDGPSSSSTYLPKVVTTFNLVQQTLLKSGNLQSWLPLTLENKNNDKSLSNLQSILKSIYCPHVQQQHQQEQQDISQNSLARQIATFGLRNILFHSSASLLQEPVILNLILEIITKFSISQQFFQLFENYSSFDQVTQSTTMSDWESLLSLYLGLSPKLLNALQDRQNQYLPLQLEWKNMQISLCNEIQKIVSQLVSSKSEKDKQDLHPDLINALSIALSRFSRVGLFQYTLNTTETNSFWPCIVPVISKRILQQEEQGRRETLLWSSIFTNVPSIDLTTISSSLFAYLQTIMQNNIDLYVDPWSTDTRTRQTVKTLAILIYKILGPVHNYWDSIVTSVVLRSSASWNESLARVIVTWIAISDDDDQRSSICFNNLDGLEKFIKLVLSVWNRKETFDRSPAVFFNYLISLLVYSTTYFPNLDNRLILFAHDISFLTAIQKALSHVRTSFRLRSMLLAEIISGITLDPTNTQVKPLSFGQDIWNGTDEDHIICKRIRSFADQRINDGSIEGLKHLDTLENAKPVQDPNHQVYTQSTTTLPSQQRRHSKVKSSSSKKSSKSTPKIQVLSSTNEDHEDDDDDDDLKPYAMIESPNSSDTENDAGFDSDDLDDPSVVQNDKKPLPPAYLSTLSEYLKSTEEYNKLEVGLVNAESLIRRKRNWGTELEVNSDDVCITLFSLNDNFGIKNFEQLRLNALVAIVSSCPTRAAPCIIEHFFKSQFSIAQKFAMLTALALGASELAGIEGPSGKGAPKPLPPDALPSKALPFRSEQKLLRSMGLADDNDDLDELTQRMTRAALTSARQDAETSIPEASRQKLLRVASPSNNNNTTGRLGTTTRRSAKITAINDNDSNNNNNNNNINRFNDNKVLNYGSIAAECFIMPMINGIWNFLRDISTSTFSRRPVGSGSVAILSPLMLTKMISTLSILVGASRNSPHFLALLAPETLNLATFGLRGYGESSHDGIDDDNDSAKSGEEVLASLLELVLIVLDGCIAVDNGRTLSRDHVTLLGNMIEWAESVWKIAEGRGGTIERAARASAGLILRIQSILEQSNRSQIERQIR